jgi:hypothetical protein
MPSATRDQNGLLQIKAELLCVGMRMSETSLGIFRRQNPCDDRKTGNVGVHLRLSNGSHVLATVHHSFDRSSPYEIRQEGKRLLLLKNDTPLDEVFEVPMPAWYGQQTAKNNRMPGLFLHEGSSFMHLTYSGCDYHARGMPCRFCAAGKQWKTSPPDEVAQTVRAALAENPAYQVCLGGGARLPLERNTSYFVKLLQEIRRINAQVPLWVEMVPPPPEDVRALVEAGATGFGFNLELWDESLRKEACPGKSDVPRSRYFDAMRAAVDLLGTNRVGSCLIVGLEKPETSMEGAEALAGMGVQPCMIPFKPWDASEYSKRQRVDAGTLLSISQSAVESMRRHGLCPHKNQGCLGCESCTVDHDLYGPALAAQ